MRYAYNKKVSFEYTILETFEAGLVLSGAEVKSARTQTVRLQGAFVVFLGSGASVVNMHIPRYNKSSALLPYDPEASRKLLLKKKEMSYLRGKIQEKGLTIVPLSLYSKGRHVKMEIALVRGKKTYDKREAIKKRDIERDVRRNNG